MLLFPVVTFGVVAPCFYSLLPQGMLHSLLCLLFVINTQEQCLVQTEPYHLSVT